MSGTALLGRFDELRPTLPPPSASGKKRVSTGKTNLSRPSAVHSVQGNGTGNEGNESMSRQASRQQRRAELNRHSDPDAAPVPRTREKKSREQVQPRGDSIISQEDRHAARQSTKVKHSSAAESPKSGIFPDANSQRLHVQSPHAVQDQSSSVVQSFKQGTSLLRFVEQVRKTDAERKCEGALEKAQLKDVVQSLGVEVSDADISKLFEECRPVMTPRSGRRVVQISSLARHIWPQAHRPANEKAKTFSREPKHLFGLRAAGLLNDTREAALMEIGEIAPLEKVNSNFSSSIYDPLSWKEAPLKFGPWLGERPLLRMEARDKKEVHGEDGWERTAVRIANANEKLHPGLRLSSVSDFYAHPRHYDFLTCATPANRQRNALKPPPAEDFRPFLVNGHVCLAPTLVNHLRGARKAADEKPSTAPDDRLTSLTATYKIQDTLRSQARSTEPDATFATSKIMPSIRSLRLFHPSDAYRHSKLDVSDIHGASPGNVHLASSLRASLNSEPLLAATRATADAQPRVVSAGEECPAHWQSLAPIRNSAFSLMQSSGTFTNSLRPGKHVW